MQWLRDFTEAWIQLTAVHIAETSNGPDALSCNQVSLFLHRSRKFHKYQIPCRWHAAAFPGGCAENCNRLYHHKSMPHNTCSFTTSPALSSLRECHVWVNSKSFTDTQVKCKHMYIQYTTKSKPIIHHRIFVLSFHVAGNNIGRVKDIWWTIQNSPNYQTSPLFSITRLSAFGVHTNKTHIKQIAEVALISSVTQLGSVWSCRFVFDLDVN